MNLPTHIRPIQFDLLWPEGLMAGIALVYVAGMATTTMNSAGALTRARILSLAGLIATAGLIFLGLLSPYYGIVALLAIPAPIIFVTAIFRPTVISQKPKLRMYLMFCVVAAAGVWVFQMFWETVR
jgi:hypothetical protein